MIYIPSLRSGYPFPIPSLRSGYPFPIPSLRSVYPFPIPSLRSGYPFPIPSLRSVSFELPPLRSATCFNLLVLCGRMGIFFFKKRPANQPKIRNLIVNPLGQGGYTSFARTSRFAGAGAIAPLRPPLSAHVT